MEMDLIRSHKTMIIGIGFNGTEGGEGLCGHTHSKETKNRIRESNIKTKSLHKHKLRSSIGRVGVRPFHCYRMDGTYVGEFQSMEMCADEIKVCSSNICFCLHNKKKYAKEYVFDFDRSICEDKARKTKKTKFRWFTVCHGNKELYRFNRIKNASNTLAINFERIRSFLRRNKKDEYGRSYKYIENAASTATTSAL
jgi:hypothetical protein